MAGLTVGTRNAMLEQLGTLIGFASLHTDDPGDDGANEVAGGSPAYARQAISWAVADAASKASSADVVFDVPSLTTISHLGYWSAAGVFRGSRPLNIRQTFPTQGVYTVPSGNIVESLV